MNKRANCIGTLYAKKMRKGWANGMIYYKDCECTQIYCKDIYKRIRTSQRLIFNGVPYWCEVMNE